MSNVVAVIPARRDSKRLPGKNKMIFKGKPLIDYTVEAAKHYRNFSEIILSTDDEDILNLYKNDSLIKTKKRPKHLSVDNTSTLAVLIDLMNDFKSYALPETLVLLQPTSPLREASLLTECLEMFQSDPEATNLVTVSESKSFTGELDKRGYWIPDFQEDLRSQDIPSKFIPTGEVFVYNVRDTLIKKRAYGEKIVPFLRPTERVVNIDYFSDIQKLKLVAEYFYSDYEYLFNTN